jgi:hypothetical protein
MKKIYVSDQDFITFISYLNIYINSGYNLFQSLKEVEKITVGSIRKIVSSLIEDMSKDKSFGPFQIFSSNFNNQIIYQLITLLYQQNKAGKTSNSIEQILPLLDRLKMIVIEDRVKKEAQYLNNFLLAPLIGAALISLYFSTGILTVLVGNIYG